MGKINAMWINAIGLIKIILNCITVEFMAHINSSMTSLIQIAPWLWGPLLRTKIIICYVYLSVILWYPTLQVSFALFTVLNSSFFVGYSFPQTFTVYQTLAISLLAIIFGGNFWVFWLWTIFYASLGTVSTRVPVRFSLSQFHIGIYFVETVPD